MELTFKKADIKCPPFFVLNWINSVNSGGQSLNLLNYIVALPIDLNTAEVETPTCLITSDKFVP